MRKTLLLSLIAFTLAFTALAQPALAKKGSSENVGLFHGCYLLGEAMPGAQTVNLNLLVNTVNETVTGFGVLSQAINPPLVRHYTIHGDTGLLYFNNNTVRLFNLTGSQPFHRPDGPPLWLIDFKARFGIDQKTGKGNGSYSYLDANGKWTTTRVKAARADCK